MNINLDDRYVRADDFQSRVEGLEFTPQIWAVFAKLDQARTAAEVAAELKLEVAAVSQAFGALGDAALIKKKFFGWNAFAAAASTPAPAAAPAPPRSPTRAMYGSAARLTIGSTTVVVSTSS